MITESALKVHGILFKAQALSLSNVILPYYVPEYLDNRKQELFVYNETNQCAELDELQTGYISRHTDPVRVSSVSLSIL